jgi:hypothetical protein
MEKFEERALNTYPLKPKRWKRYVDNPNVVWPQGRDDINKFLNYLNNLLEDIKFTMELEENNNIPFLDVMIHRNKMATCDIKSIERKCILRTICMQVLITIPPKRWEF